MANLRAVIFTALRVEFEAVRDFLSDSQIVHHKAGNIYERGVFQGNRHPWDVGIVEVGMGDVNAAIETERAINFFVPDVILFVGIAGGIKDVEIGDVVASTKIYGYESGKAKAKETFEPRPELGLSSYALIQQAKAERRSPKQEWLNRLRVNPEKLPKVEVGAIAAGEKVIASRRSKVYEFLRQQYGDALAVEMEGYGFLKAAHANEHRAVAMVVRGISDLIEGKNDEVNQDPEDIRQEQASRHASAFAFQLLANFTPKERVLDVISVSPQESSTAWDSLFNSFHGSEPQTIQSLASLLEKVLSPVQRDPYPELSQVESMTLEILRPVVDRLDRLDLVVNWVKRIIGEIEEQPEGELSGLVLSDLKAWLDQHQTSAEEAELDPESESATEQKEEALEYLLIALDPKDDEDTVFLTAEVQAADGTVLNVDLLPPGTKCAIDDPPKALSKAINKAGEVESVEVFLSWRHFRQPIHEWKIKRGLGQSMPLKWLRNILLRSLDRLVYEDEDLVDEWLQKLRSQWERLPCCGELDLADYRHEVTTADFEALGSTLVQQSKYLICHLLAELPAEPEDLQELFGVLLESGIPIWLWSHRGPVDADRVSEALATLLGDMSVLRQPSRLAASIRKPDTPLSNLGLLCECPHRLPVLVDWKGGRLRPPAA